MAKKGGSSTRPVFDYHLSIDYGFCMGPVDHFNKLWIKDKTVWCGLYYTRTDIVVNLPELFGGDDAEGGVGGINEIYVGSNEQYSSWELSSRWGLNPGAAPGYRGQAHLFFRGNVDSDVIEGEISESADPDFNTMLTYIPTDQVGDTPDPAAARGGWKWTANNPYLPAAKASITRLPKIGFADSLAAIWPGAGLDDDGNIVGLATVDQEVVVPGQDIDLGDPDGVFDIGIQNGSMLDLYEIGFSQGQIDAGQAKIVVEWAMTVYSENTYDLGTVTTTTEIRFYDTNPPGWDSPGQVAPVSGEEALVSNDVVTSDIPKGERDRGDVYPSTGSATGALGGTVTAPPGSRYIRVRGLFELGQYIFALEAVQTAGYHDEYDYTQDPAYTPGSYGKGPIDVYLGDPPPPEPDPEPPTDVAPANDTFRPIFTGPLKVQTTPPTKIGNVIDLIALGFTEEELDNGYIYVRARWEGVTYQSIPALPDGSSLTSLNVSFYDEPVVNWYDATIGGGYSSGPTSDSEHSHDSGYIVAPSGTRFIQFRAAYTPSVGETTDVYNNIWEIGYYSYDVQHCAADDLIGPLPDANPARIVYDCLTNGEWGKGEDPSMIDTASFNTVAQTLYDERFGLSFAFFEQDKIENFISEVLDHIQGFLYQDPTTGLWTMSLLRDDYDAESLPVLDETNCIAENRKRRLWGETINEVVISYTDPQTEKPATVAAQDLGNIAIQGGTISETREYYGIRNALLAQVVAYRDVRSAGYPLFSCQIKVDRRGWNLRPGDVRRFSWPDDQIENMVVRIMSIDYGKPSDRTITLNVTEDIFSIEKSKYGAPQTTEWVNVEQPPSPVDVQAAFTVPLPSLIRSGVVVEDFDADYPVVAGAIFADEDGIKPPVIDVHTAVTRNNGSTKVQKTTELTPTYSSLLMEALPMAVESQIRKNQIDAILKRPGQEGEFFMIGYKELLTEIIMLDTYNASTKKWTVKRGMWDTVPISWPKGVRIWYFSESASSVDTKERASGETVTYYLLPRTSLGTLDFDDANPLTVTYTDRPFAPFRPADAQLDGNGFDGIVVREAPFPTEFEATWKNRNRTTEDQVSLSWDDDSAAMEAGQTVTLRILDDLGNIHMDIDGLTGESYTIDATDLPPGLEGYIQFLSKRDGFTSIFGARRYFDIRPPSGYGLAYGLDYGGQQD